MPNPEISHTKNRRTGHPAMLSPYRNKPLGRPAPRREFRVPVAEPSPIDDVLIGLVGGASGSLADLQHRMSWGEP
jgi:hypothetical protein